MGGNGPSSWLACFFFFNLSREGTMITVSVVVLSRVYSVFALSPERTSIFQLPSKSKFTIYEYMR